MGKIAFETRHYEDGSLNRFEANDFVEDVVASAFPVTQTITEHLVWTMITWANLWESRWNII